MKTKHIQKILKMGISVILIVHCGYAKEQKNETETSNLLATIMATEFYYYRYNCPPYKLLDTGTTTVHLNQGEEFWFDFKARIFSNRLPNQDRFRIQIQESPGQDVKLSIRSCLVNFNLSNPQIPFAINSNFLSDSGLLGQLELFNIFYSQTIEGGTMTTIKATTGSGNVSITLPNNSN